MWSYMFQPPPATFLFSAHTPNHSHNKEKKGERQKREFIGREEIGSIG